MTKNYWKVANYAVNYWENYITYYFMNKVKNRPWVYTETVYLFFFKTFQAFVTILWHCVCVSGSSLFNLLPRCLKCLPKMLSSTAKSGLTKLFVIFFLPRFHYIVVLKLRDNNNSINYWWRKLVSNSKVSQLKAMLSSYWICKVCLLAFAALWRFHDFDWWNIGKLCQSLHLYCLYTWLVEM